MIKEKIHSELLEREQDHLFSAALEKIAEQGPIFSDDEEFVEDNPNERR